MIRMSETDGKTVLAGQADCRTVVTVDVCATGSPAPISCRSIVPSRMVEQRRFTVWYCHRLISLLILDDFSRYIVAWKLCTTMKAEDVTDTLQLALAASGCDSARVIHKPRLLNDNGSSYVSADLAEWLDDNGMDHVRGAPHHPQTQGKIERWHQTLKNRILLENY